MPVSGTRPRGSFAPAATDHKRAGRDSDALSNAGPLGISKRRPGPRFSCPVLRRAQQDRKEESSMSHRMNAERFRRAIAAAGLAAGAALTAAPALAGACPADQVKPGVRAAGETTPKGVTDTVLGQVDLASERVSLADRRLRLRRLVVQPGGIVPWHSHEDRPALITVVSGTVEEYASNCAVPIRHTAGDVSVEKLGVRHWWKNTGKTPAVLLSADLFHEERASDDHVM